MTGYPTMDLVLRNILLGISLAAPIGPSGIAVIQNGLRQGFRRAFFTGLGVTLADATYLLIVFFGVSSLMAYPSGWEYGSWAPALWATSA